MNALWPLILTESVKIRLCPSVNSNFFFLKRWCPKYSFRITSKVAEISLLNLRWNTLLRCNIFFPLITLLNFIVFFTLKIRVYHPLQTTPRGPLPSTTSSSSSPLYRTPHTESPARHWDIFFPHYTTYSERTVTTSASPPPHQDHETEGSWGKQNHIWERGDWDKQARQ